MNCSILVGRITAIPELRTTPTGVAVTRITIAVNRMPNANGERIADFINVVVWRKQAEKVVKYCTKGSLVGIEGRLQTRSYEAQDGSKRYATEVIANNVTFLGNKSSNGGQQPLPVNNNSEQQTQPTQIQLEEDPFSEFGEEVIINDDDLPF